MMNKHKITNINLEQMGGANVVMSTNTVLTNANLNAATQTFYNNVGNRNVLYMRGEIKGNLLDISLISALLNNGNQQDVSNVVPTVNVAPNFSWSKKTTIGTANNHLIEIKEGSNIYSQHHLATIAAVKQAAIAEALRLSTVWNAPPGANGLAAIAACTGPAGPLVVAVNAVPVTNVLSVDIDAIRVAIAGVGLGAGAANIAAQGFLQLAATVNAIMNVASASLNGNKYKFCQNSNPGVPLVDVTPTAVVIPQPVPVVAGGAVPPNAPGPIFATKEFLIVDLTNTKVYNGTPGATDPDLLAANMTEEIINFLLHQLVQYKLAKNILCVYEENKVTSITIGVNPASPTLTSYVNYDNIRLANETHNNVFSQCFKYISKNKIVHAVTCLEPSDSSISMKYCSSKNMNDLSNLAKALAISNPFNRRLNEESVFYLCLRVHTLRTGNGAAGGGANNADMVQAQRTAGDEFLSGTFGTNAGAINPAKLIDMNSPNRLAVRFDYIGTGVALVNKGIGRFVVDLNGNLMTYNEDTQTNVRLVCYNRNAAANENLIQPYDRYIQHKIAAAGTSLMQSPIIKKSATGNYQLVIQTKTHNNNAIGNRIFINVYDPVAALAAAAAAPATHPLPGAGQIAMHVCTTSTSEIQSNLTLADALFE